MPENDEVVEIRIDELNMLMDLVGKLTASDLRAVESISSLMDALKKYTAGTAKREEAFKAAIEGLSIVVNVPEQPAPVVNVHVVPSEVIVQEAPEKRKTLTITRDQSGKITGGYIE